MNYKRNWRLIKLIPGPPGLPIAGNVFQWHISESKYKIFNLFILINK